MRAPSQSAPSASLYGSDFGFDAAGVVTLFQRTPREEPNANRVSCNIPTKYMLEAANEVGFMLIPEAVDFGNFVSVPGPVHAQTVREMGWLCRNHPSVMRYSLGNETRGNMEPWRPLIDAMLEVDDARPLIFERQGEAGGKFAGIERGHAYDTAHYGNIVRNDGKDKIFNMGECCWVEGDGMPWFAWHAMKMRLCDWAYFAPWCWLNYWPNFFEGMNHDKHVLKTYNPPDRVDGVNGWGSSVVALVQRALHPYLVLDVDVLEDPGMRSTQRRRTKSAKGMCRGRSASLFAPPARR